MALLGPGIEEGHQVASEPPNQPWQGRGQRRQASFPGSVRRSLSSLGQQRAQLGHDRIVLVQKGQQCPGRIQPSNDHDDQRFDEQLIGVGWWTASFPLLRRRRKRQGIDQAYQADKNAVTVYHLSTSSALSWVLKCWGGRGVRASPARALLVNSTTYDL